MQGILDRSWWTFLRPVARLGALALLAACEAPAPEVAKPVNFRDIDRYAGRARAAYQDEAQIREAYPDTEFVGSPAGTEVLYFLETQPARRRQIITVRGTDNLENVLQDLEYLRAEDNSLGIAVHCGFDADTRAIYADLKPRLKPGYEIYLTGHSLGAAISTLLMMHLQQDGYRVAGSVNFGQPKLTNRAGAQKYADLPLTRVVDGKDLVPLLPADTVLDSIGGEFTHLGSEVILLDGPYYIYLDRTEASRESRGSFWHDLGDESLDAHAIGNYITRIAAKLSRELQVPLADRDEYLQP